MFSVLDIVSVVFSILLVLAAVIVYRYLRKQVDDAEGLCSINDGDEEGDVVGELGISGAEESDKRR